jgi:hypothetical protein
MFVRPIPTLASSPPFAHVPPSESCAHVLDAEVRRIHLKIEHIKYLCEMGFQPIDVHEALTKTDTITTALEDLLSFSDC